VLQTRVIPCLLLSRGRLVKTIGFSDPQYVGDPINAVRIFNEKEVDELLLLDIDASREAREPNYDLINDIVSEAFMPVGYGGGVKTTEHAERVVALGVEKVLVNSAALDNMDLVGRLSDRLGSSSTVVGIDVAKNWRHRYRVYDPSRRKTTDVDPTIQAQRAAEAGAGEILVNDVTRDGTGSGFDLDLIALIAAAVNVPVIACGGAGKLGDLRTAADAGASAVAAGSLFVYVGRHRAVMITYPTYDTLTELLK
jgi:imidazole glycerol-phosphate synthase subunit HisF